jgi:hypothetical protein
MTYETLAALNAATKPGRSCVSHRTDDFGSGSRTQMSAVAEFLLEFATAPVTDALTAKAAITRTTMSFFTIHPPCRSDKDVRQTNAQRDPPSESPQGN